MNFSARCNGVHRLGVIGGTHYDKVTNQNAKMVVLLVPVSTNSDCEGFPKMYILRVLKRILWTSGIKLHENAVGRM